MEADGSGGGGAAARQDGLDEILYGKTVLIVEDEGLTVMQYQRMLARAGLRLIGRARSGPDGVKAALRERPNIVLMDANMPGDYGGIEATRRITREYPACVVVITARADEWRAARDAGACSFVVKPVSGETLLKRMAEAMRLTLAGEHPLVQALN